MAAAMTDLTERVEQAAEALHASRQQALGNRAGVGKLKECFHALSKSQKYQWRVAAEAAIRTAFPELFSDPPTHVLWPVMSVITSVESDPNDPTQIHIFTDSPAHLSQTEGHPVPDESHPPE
ncbi:MAG: hypothetical protein Q8R92_06300 [Deltaproteobacteria bacterium]|nr:hypothetical protein [Deltaproteobacteria bacterium]